MKFQYPSGSTPLPGYTIKRGVGVGGFGEVYFAVTDGGKQVALKLIQRNLDIELRGVRQCLNLKHTNLLSLYDIKYDDAERAWVVMEYVGGASLKDAIEQHPDGMPRELVDSWIRGIATGLAYLHDHGIVHRDLKPGNIFCDENVVKIGDYGLSKFISISRHSGQTESVGTLHYMAPEIGQGRYGKEIDVYALGVILYEMLTGNVPFDGESSQEIIMKHLTAEPDLSRVAPPYREVIAKALHKDPEQRYDSVVVMLEQLGLKPADGVGPLPAGGDCIMAEPYEPPVAVAPRQPLPAKVPSADEPIAAMPIEDRRITAEEPIARTVQTAWFSMHDWFGDEKVPLALRIVVAVVGGVFLLANMSWLLPAAIVYGIYYLFYRLFAALLDHDEPSASETAMSADRRYLTHPVRVKMRDVLAARPTRQKARELIGSMLLTFPIAAVLCLLVMFFPLGRLPAHQWAATYAWMTLVTLVGTWCILIPSKYWENHGGEQTPRRFTLLVIGLGLGALAWLGTVALAVVPAYEIEIGTNSTIFQHLAPTMYAANGDPRWPVYVGFFAAVMVALRWWRLADPLRPARLRFLPLIGYVFFTFLLDQFWPLPCGIFLVLLIGATVQLASPWMNFKERNEARCRFVESYKSNRLLEQQ